MLQQTRLKRKVSLDFRVYGFGILVCPSLANAMLCVRLG